MTDKTATPDTETKSRPKLVGFVALASLIVGVILLIGLAIVVLGEFIGSASISAKMANIPPTTLAQWPRVKTGILMRELSTLISTICILAGSGVIFSRIGLGLWRQEWRRSLKATLSAGLLFSIAAFLLGAFLSLSSTVLHETYS